jgi:hypothetical protein
MMTNKLGWYKADEILHLELENNLSLDEMKHINQCIVEMLDKSRQKMVLLVDMSELVVGYGTADQLRSTQRYMDHPKLESIVVIANKKLNRLIALLAFNLARAHLIQVNNEAGLESYLTRRSLT